MNHELISIEVLPKDTADPFFEQRESGRSHTPYQTEVMIYSCIQAGDAERLKLMVKEHLSQGLVVGRLSNNDLRQAQYMAVSCITLAVRYAIQGGMEEFILYNLSDRYIQEIDSLESSQEIYRFLAEKLYGLAQEVSKIAGRAPYSAPIRRCVSYISRNLHDKIRLAALAAESGLSQDYLSALFKKELGLTIGAYIMKQKLAEARVLLREQYGPRHVAFILGFCSQSYFIRCFKKEFGLTPRQYAGDLG
ncbi:MAG: AraC family transcriptional regulator [Treponema sp.]|jgi:AraC-like DNA-binding protein|nr:AraC family transcriptional regulator [Treponema sp.]